MQTEPLRFFSDDQIPKLDRHMNAFDGGANRCLENCGLPDAASATREELAAALPATSTIVEQANQVAFASRPARTHGAYELKFLIDDDRAEQIMAWAREHLEPDPHAEPELGDRYRVNSLYLDTAQFDVFHRSNGFGKQKYRLRRYGTESRVWFEQKQKRKGIVRKRRVSVDDADVARRLVHFAEADWNGHWFREKLDKQGLQPICQVTYERFARVKATDEGPIRVTVDDHLTARLADGWNVPTGSLEGVGLLEDQRILELKFRDAMPALFRRLIETERLLVTRFSKYRTSVEECVELDSLVGGETRSIGDA